MLSRPFCRRSKRTMEARSKEAPLLPDVARKRIEQLHAQGRYQESLDICLQITRSHPHIAQLWGDAAVNCLYLGRWQDAAHYGQAALARGYEGMELHDTLAHAHGELGQWDETRRYGLQALRMRERLFGGAPVVPLPELSPMPPPPSAQTRERNIIAFSLFGGDSRYCEPAVLNVQEQPQVYPHWVCRFYVDGSVPGDVIERLRTGGAQIVLVDGPAAQWPGPMWRLLALADQQAHRIVFRDADSVISRREAAAVGQWVTSDKRFHMMRDWCSHTELMLAGLWGVVGGSLPPLEQLMQHFMSAPLASRRFADQYFLRQYVWPYARTSLMQHDSVFGFMDAMPFPDGERSDDRQVGSAEGVSPFTQKSDLPNGSEVIWKLYLLEWPDDGPVRAELVCAYPGTVKDGVVTGQIPARYSRRIQQGTACVRLSASDAAQPDASAPAQWLAGAATNRIGAFMEQGRFQEALEICLQMTRIYPELVGAWVNAAINCAMLGRWQDAMEHAQTALARGRTDLVLYDTLAHAYGMLGHWSQARRYGLQALELRDSRFGGEPAIPLLDPGPLPPPPSAQTRQSNVIAFSLFGSDPKYCEPAILNVQEQPSIYPHWTCRFYVDGSVPENVINRLRAGGAQIVPVDGRAAQWPGPMWRLLALQDPQAHRILFRDADAVISRREAAAVDQWLTSGKRFHMMRDWGSHTELILAGLWGVVAGSLPPLEKLMERFMSVPLQSRHFADQHFLRQYVWPYARASLMQHDSVFGFLDAAPFPEGEKTESFHVGCSEKVISLSAKIDLPNGSKVVCELYLIPKHDDGQACEQLVYTHTYAAQEGTVQVHIPERYARQLQQGTARIRLLGGNALTAGS
jgi:tetratricopeptide (TPR) repeat protein